MCWDLCLGIMAHCFLCLLSNFLSSFLLLIAGLVGHGKEKFAVAIDSVSSMCIFARPSFVVC